MCKVYTSYCGTSEIEHGLCACTVDNPLAKARGLSLRTGAQPMLYLPLIHPATGSIASAISYMGTPPCLSAISTKQNSYSDFIFNFLDDVIVPKRWFTVKEKNWLLGQQILPLKN